MIGWIRAYTRWLHTQWPAGTLEKLPVVSNDGTTNVPGLYIVGDLTGIPLLKFSADTGAKAVRHICDDKAFQSLKGEGGDETYDVVIVGGGVSGMAAALEAEEKGLKYVLLEASDPFSTIVNFPKGKPIFTYPTDMTPAGKLQFTAQVKEPLVDELKQQTASVEIKQGRVEQINRSGKLLEVPIAGGETLKARRVIVGIGRSGNFRKLGVPGEELDKVINRLHDPKDYVGKHVLIVGGGDSAVEGAIALVQGGANVTLSYRKAELTRPKPENVEKLKALAENPNADVEVDEPVSERETTATGRWVKDAMKLVKADTTGAKLTLALGTNVKEITETEVTLRGTDGDQTIPNDAVFAMIGREAPLDFFRRSGVTISGERNTKWWAGFIAFFGFSTFLYHWKSFAPAKNLFKENGWFPYNSPEWFYALGGYDPSTLLGTMALTVRDQAFWYSLAYSLAICIFGWRRIKRRNTPYVTRQTTILAAIQVVPLFLLPFIVLPWMGHNGLFGRFKQVNVLRPAQIQAIEEAGKTWQYGYKQPMTEQAVAQRLLPAVCASWGKPELTWFDGNTAVFKDAAHDGKREAKIEAKIDLGSGKVTVEGGDGADPAPLGRDKLDALKALGKQERQAAKDRALTELGQDNLPTAVQGWKAPRLDKFDGGTAIFVDSGLEQPGDRFAKANLKDGVVHVIDKTAPDSWTATQLFPIVSYDANGREYWRASGIILAWPLFIWNVFTGNPMWLWLGISLVQTFILIPALIYRFGKGAYCGWICSCGALAETMGDAHRAKMPHGPFWNRMNMIGQFFLLSAFVLLFMRIGSWIAPASGLGGAFNYLLSGLPVFNYAYFVDLWWAGIIGVGCYFHFSGRVWCRFACPLAALMHIYSRFSRFRIIPEKKKCISCNVCTSVCHQGIDVMNFANKGIPMADPQCVRCSACVQSCPTGVLQFGEVDKDGKTIRLDTLAASPVQIAEQKAGQS